MPCLCLFARDPQPGRVKTRLSPALPGPLAARLYAGLLGDTWAAAAACTRATRRVVHWADATGTTPPGFTARVQRGGDLGERLTHAFADELAAGGPVLLIGSDTPSLTAAHLDTAFAALETSDVVVGPTLDGGYWGLGLREPAPQLFTDIPWSTREVLVGTLVRAHASGLRVTTVDTLEDLDTPHDLALLVGALAAGRAAAGVHTRAALEGMGLAPTA